MGDVLPGAWGRKPGLPLSRAESSTSLQNGTLSDADRPPGFVVAVHRVDPRLSPRCRARRVDDLAAAHVDSDVGTIVAVVHEVTRLYGRQGDLGKLEYWATEECGSETPACRQAKTVTPEQSSPTEGSDDPQT